MKAVPETSTSALQFCYIFIYLFSSSFNRYPGLPEGWYEPIDEYDYLLDQCADMKEYDDQACVVR